MKLVENHFIDYINRYNNNFHNINYKINNIESMNNLIIYGPPGVGKYTQTLNLLKDISPSSLKYEKKINILFNKNNYFIKISDIHYEVDMSLLGCNSKLLWFEIYNQIIDIITAKTVKTGIIVCKNFSDIHNELLEIFYSYMQLQFNSSLKIKFILIATSITFLPENIINSCQKLVIPRPPKSAYNKIIQSTIQKTDCIYKINNIRDINEKNNSHKIMQQPYKNICDQIVETIVNYNNIKFLELRENLYDICIFDLNIYNCINYIFKQLIDKNKLDREKMNKILLYLYDFFKLYNNNYRPIYHLERYILYILTTVNEL